MTSLFALRNTISQLKYLCLIKLSDFSLICMKAVTASFFMTDGMGKQSSNSLCVTRRYIAETSKVHTNSWNKIKLLCDNLAKYHLSQNKIPDSDALL